MSMSDEDKTHYRKAFNSPYLSSSDIVEPTVLTIQRVSLEPDKTKKSKDLFNTAYFVEPEIRHGEALKPMILNAHNSRIMRNLCGSHFLEDWRNVPVTIYVDSAVRFGKETDEGLRISPNQPCAEKPWLTPEAEKKWGNAVAAYKRDGNLDKVRERVQVSPEHEEMIKEAASVPVS
jgi:hypothetical protein